MKKLLLLLLAVTSTSFSLSSPHFLQKEEIINAFNHVIDRIVLILRTEYQYTQTSPNTLDEIKDMLHNEANTLNMAVINKVLTTMQCAKAYHIDENNMLTIIDYSLPSNEKRLWVFDLKEKKLLFNTYVSHGIKSGTLLTNYFSNKNNSKASSMGVYKTEKSYYGRHGLSLQLDGLERGFNDNASSRAVVMHGGWYVDEHFIKKYGRAGRSWGCPAVPTNLTESIINTIKEKSIFIVYYPSDDWFVKSKFLNCSKLSTAKKEDALEPKVKPMLEESEIRENILFADLNKNNRREESEPIVVMTADHYERMFHTKVPLERMLRRQINHIEYIALSNNEFKNMAAQQVEDLNMANRDMFNEVYFVIPVVKMVRGYYATEMHMVNLGRIKEVRLDSHSSDTNEQIKDFTVTSEAKPMINLKSTNQFIRWLGL